MTEMRAQMLAGTVFLLLFGCATEGTERLESDFDGISIRSRDWINPTFNDVRAQILVERISDRLHVMKAQLSVPLHPGVGTDPTSFVIFQMCVARSLAKKFGYDGWSFGYSEPEKSLIGARESEQVVGFLKKGETTEVLGRSDLKWHSAMIDSPPLKTTCEKILRPEYL